MTETDSTSTATCVNDIVNQSTHQYMCSYPDCNKFFSRPSRLEQHIRTHTGERPYACKYADCAKTYTRSAHLQRHIDTAHGSNTAQPKLRCPIEGCEEYFVSKTNVRKHVKRKHEAKKYKCSYDGCTQSFNKHNRLKFHENVHSCSSPYICPIDGCDRGFTMKSKMLRHLKQHEGYTCKKEGCDESFSKWSLLRKHVALVHKTEYRCSECSEIFPKKCMLKMHLAAHSNEVEMFACPISGCPRVYSAMRNLKAHIQSYHERQRYVCTYKDCGRSFISNWLCVLLLRQSDFHLFPNIKKHLAGKHFDSDDDIISAVTDFFDDQDETFYKAGIQALLAEQKLKEHEKQHDPDRPIPKKKSKKSSSRKISMAARLANFAQTLQEASFALQENHRHSTDSEDEKKETDYITCITDIPTHCQSSP